MRQAITKATRSRLIQQLQEAPEGYTVEISEPKRTEPQNRLIHPVAREIQKHMEAHGAPKRHEEWWRYYLLGKWRGTEITPDPDGSGKFVVINNSAGTSGLNKAEASEFTEWMYAFGTDIGVRFPAQESAA